MIWYEPVLDALGVPPHRRCAVKWMIRCKAHDDSEPSLSVGINRAGDRVLVHCFAGCTPEEVMAAAGMKMGDLFRPDGENGAVPFRERKIVQTDAFLDESGQVLFEEVRYEPKDFRQRRPDGLGGWAWSLSGVRLVLLHTPEIARMPGEEVWVVEGLKAVRALRSPPNNILPGVAIVTAHAGGCGMGWRDEYAAQLKGRRVVLLPDNDAPGRALMMRAAGSLIAHGVGSLKWCDLPGREDSEGADDWMAKFGAKALKAAVRECPEWKAAPSKPTWRA